MARNNDGVIKIPLTKVPREESNEETPLAQGEVASREDDLFLA